MLWRQHFWWLHISGFDEFIFVVGLVFESLCGTLGARGDGRGGGAAEMDFLHSSIRPYQNWHPTRACHTTILFYHTKDFPVLRFSTTSELDHPQVKPPPQHVAQRCQKRDFKCEAVTMVMRPLKAVTSSHSLKADTPSPGNWRSNWREWGKFCYVHKYLWNTHIREKTHEDNWLGYILHAQTEFNHW